MDSGEEDRIALRNFPWPKDQNSPKTVLLFGPIDPDILVGLDRPLKKSDAVRRGHGRLPGGVRDSDVEIVAKSQLLDDSLELGSVGATGNEQKHGGHT
jgi:hypothetical protein